MTKTTVTTVTIDGRKYVHGVNAFRLWRELRSNPDLTSESLYLHLRSGKIASRTIDNRRYVLVRSMRAYARGADAGKKEAQS